MKRLLIYYVMLFCTSIAVKAQSDVLSIAEIKIKETGDNLNQVRQELAHLSDNLNSNRSNQQQQITLLRRSISKVDSIQQLLDTMELNVYRHNYNAAMLQLYFLNEKGRTLELFTATQEFYDGLNKIGNPLSYSEYITWMKEFDVFLTKKSKKMASLNLVRSFLNSDGSLSTMARNNIPFMSLLTEGITLFLDNNKKEDKLWKEGNEILNLNVKLASFNNEINSLLNESTTAELIKRYRQLYDTVCNKNLLLLKKSRDEFNNSSGSGISSKTYQDNLSIQSFKFVDNLKRENPRNWKTEVNRQLTLVQKVDGMFRDVVFQIYEDLKLKKAVLNRYSKDTDISKHIGGVDQKADDLLKKFDGIFKTESAASRIENIYLIP